MVTLSDIQPGSEAERENRRIGVPMGLPGAGSGRSSSAVAARPRQTACRIWRARYPASPRSASQARSSASPSALRPGRGSRVPSRP